MKYKAGKHHQDRWVVETTNYKKKGYFVDIGASNGTHGSTTFILEKKYNWNGICVEPHEQFFKSLCERRNCICVNVCIADKKGEVDFVERGVYKERSGIYCSDADEGVTEIVELRNHPLVKKQAITLLNLLEEHGAPKTIDYLSMDTEGTVWLILKNFDFTRYTFLLITLEHNDEVIGGKEAPQHRKIKRAKIKKLLESNGYYRDKIAGPEDFYIHKSLKHKE